MYESVGVEGVGEFEKSSKSVDLEAPGVKVIGFGGSRHQNRWILRLQASRSMGLVAPGMKIDGFRVPGISIDGIGGYRHQN